MPPPSLNDSDRRRATESAGQARAKRAALKRGLKDGSITLGTLLDQGEVDPVVARMPVVDVLAALPAHGRVKAADLMRQAAIAPNRRLGGLGHRQRQFLIEYLASRS
ncbi:MAG: integration host factor, actinobacterial type [Nitriliruptoraceae bacterium]